MNRKKHAWITLAATLLCAGCRTPPPRVANQPPAAPTPQIPIGHVRDAGDLGLPPDSYFDKTWMDGAEKITTPKFKKTATGELVRDRKSYTVLYKGAKTGAPSPDGERWVGTVKGEIFVINNIGWCVCKELELKPNGEYEAVGPSRVGF